MRVLIIGCGYVGTALARLLRPAGGTVMGVTRSTAAARQLAADGIPSCVADCATPEGARRAGREPADAVVLAVSSRGRDPRRTYVEGLRRILETMEAHPAPLFIYTGSTSVYAQTDGGWVTEESDTQPRHATGRVLLETEQILKDAVGRLVQRACVLRLSAIYGPARHGFLDRLREGIQVLRGDGETWMNQAHRDDIAAAIQMLTGLRKSLPPFSVYNVTDDHPVRQREFAEWCCARLGRPVPAFDPRAKTDFPAPKDALANRRVSNQALRQLGWAPKYPSFREGLEPLLGEAVR